jgi:hypothetical protein
MLYGQVGDLTDRLFGYHCDHTRQVTPAHKRAAVENSIAQFFDLVNEPGIDVQAENWGCADTEIGAFQLGSGPDRAYLSGLEAAIREPMTEVSEVGYLRETYDEITSDGQHVMPFLADVLASMPKTWNVAWFGANRSMLELFRIAWPKLQFTGKILYATEAGDGAVPLDSVTGEEALREADFFVVDFSLPDNCSHSSWDDSLERAKLTGVLIRSFQAIVNAEHQRGENNSGAPRRIIAINAIHTRFESLIRSHIEYARSPLSSRLRHGYVLPAERKDAVSLLGLMTPKLAGRRVGDFIRAPHAVRGYVVSGPHVSLLPGAYVLKLEIQPEISKLALIRRKLKVKEALAASSPSSTSTESGPEFVSKSGKTPRIESKWKKSGIVAIEIRNGDRVISRHRLSLLDLLMRRNHYLKIHISADDAQSAEPSSLNVRVWTGGWIGFMIRRLDLAVAG